MNRYNMNADSLIDEMIKDARDYLIKSRLHVGTAVSVRYKSVRAAFYGLKSKDLEALNMALIGLDSELQTVIPSKEEAFEKERENLLLSYNEVTALAGEILEEYKPLSAMGLKKYETVDHVLCQLNMEQSRLKHVSLEEIKSFKKSKLTFDGLLSLNSEGKTVKEKKEQTVKKLAPGKDAESTSLADYIAKAQAADKAAQKKNKKTSDKLMQDIESALELDERVVLKLKNEGGRTPKLARFKVLGLAEKDDTNFVMVRNPWDDGRIIYEKTKGSGKTVARAKNEDDKGALYITEDAAGALMEIL